MTSGDRAAWRYYLRFYRDSAWQVVFIVAVSVALSLLILPVALLLRNLFDRVIPSGDLGALVLIGVAIIVVTLAQGGAAIWTSSVALTAIKRAIQRFREELLTRVFSLSRMHYSTADRKILHANIVQDTERLDVMSAAVLTQVLPALAITLVLVVILAGLNWVLCSVLLALSPLYALTHRLLRRRVEHSVRRFQSAFSKFSAGMWFVLHTMDLTRIQAAEEFEMMRQRGHVDEVRASGRTMTRLFSVYSNVQAMVSSVSGFFILIIGGIAIVQGRMSVGDLISFYVIAQLLKVNVNTMLNAIPGLTAGTESLRTLHGIVALDDEHCYTGSQRIEFTGAVALEDVSFGYVEEPFLRGVSLDVSPGRTLALIGPNGSGKSTLVSLILGFYRPGAGRVLVDGHPYDQLDMMALRRAMGVVMQDPIIFSGTIMENITYGYADATSEEVREAAELATADQFIQQLPQEYETPVGEHGILLSGGQRQRIAIARALLRRPRLLILDEPTNHLDVKSIHRLVANLKTLHPRPSILLISHDADVVREADDAYVVQSGTVRREPIPTTESRPDSAKALQF